MGRVNLFTFKLCSFDLLSVFYRCCTVHGQADIVEIRDGYRNPVFNRPRG